MRSYSSLCLSFCVALSIAGPSLAQDLRWEVERGALVLEAVKGDFGIFRYERPDGSVNPDSAMFVAGFGKYAGAKLPEADALEIGRHAGHWYNYKREKCEIAATDPKGNESRHWGEVSIMIGPEGRFLDVWYRECEEPKWVEVMEGDLRPGTR